VGTHSLEEAGQGRLVGLSLAGLRHVHELGCASVETVAARLYAWHRLPASGWRRLAWQPDLLHVELVARASHEWVLVAAGPPAGPWWAWRPRARLADAPGGIWKLYISPQPNQLYEAVRAAFAQCIGLPVTDLKYGGDAQGVLRPDKLVVHFQTREAVDVAVERLSVTLSGCPVHGVPFSAELAGDGLLSYGCDPPPGSSASRTGLSWRAWITRRLAEALASPGQSGCEPWRAALAHVARAGVDPTTWAPAADIWTLAEADPPGAM
jgi:hypothetical protein